MKLKPAKGRECAAIEAYFESLTQLDRQAGRQAVRHSFVHSFDLITFEAPRLTYFMRNDLLKFQAQQAEINSHTHNTHRQRHINNGGWQESKHSVSL